MACYAGLLLAPAEGFARSFFCPSGKKIAYHTVLANFWCPVVTLVTFSSNLSNFERNRKKPKNPKIIQKIKKVSKNQKKN